MRTRLFIGELEADLTGTPDILFTFQTDDVSNPTAVKNSYSKTVTLVGTKQNNRIFDEYWLPEHVTDDSRFDPSKKTPFKIFMDSELVQEGYCRLDKVTTKDNLPQYSLSLFGGLGEFFYTLSQNEDGTKKTLADLQMFVNPDAQTPENFDFIINQDTVASAWTEIQSYSSKWGTINFAPALQGYPQSFSADRCLMIYPQSTDGPIGELSHTEDGETYAPYSTGGYLLAEMNRERTADEMREFRSYLMRPVLSVQKTIENICRPVNNGNWKVSLDPEFFRYDNQWYAQAWVTLASITSLANNAQEVDTGVTMSIPQVSTESGYTSTGWWTNDDTYFENRLTTFNGMDGDKVYSVGVDFDLTALVPGLTDSLTLYPSAKYTIVHPSGGRNSRFDYKGSVFVQLVAYDAGGNAVAGSKVLNLTGLYPSDPSTFGITYPYGDTTYDTYTEGFVGSNGAYTWGRTLHLDINKVPRGARVVLSIVKACHANGTAQARLSTETKGVFDYYTRPTGQPIPQYNVHEMTTFNVNVTSYSVSAERNESMRSNTEVKIADLLKTSYSPADFILSYAKVFGLYFVKDPVKREISILSRKSFFKRDEIVDIEDRIDRTQWDTTPILAKAKWYKWDHVPSGEYSEEYKKTYGKDYGEYDYPTSYDFDSNTEDVLKNDKTFKGAVQVLERGTDFWYTGDDTWKPWMYDGYKYVLYSTRAPSETYEVVVPMSTSVDVATHIPGREYYDLFDKVQLHGANNNATGGEGVLLFFDRMVDLNAGSQPLKYYITDDCPAMAILNDGQPCWFWTNGEYDYDSRKVATRVTSVPKFSRYLVSDAGYILNAWDFGQPAETYVPGTTYREDSTIFNTFWKSYIDDIYHRDTRKVRTKMLLEDKVTVDWLRRFYRFSNSVWRMDKIENCDITDRKMTDVEFVKVQDVANYDNEVPSIYGTITLTFSPATVPASGDTIQFTINVSDGGPWYLEAPYDSDLVWSATAGTGNYTGTVTVPANQSITERQIPVYAYADPASCLAYIGVQARTASVQYIGTSYPGGSPSDHIPASGGTAYFRVNADTGWTVSGVLCTPSPVSGTSGETIISAIVGANSDNYQKFPYIVLTLDGGTRVESTRVTQDVPASSFIIVSPQSHTSPAEGDTFDITVSASADWLLTATYGWLTIAPTSGTSGITTVTVTAPENDSAQRISDIAFSFQSTPLQVQAHCNVTQEEPVVIVNKMWYKSSVKITPNGGTAKIADVSGHTCTVSDSVMVSTGTYAPHWEFQFSGNYTPEVLSGATFSGNTNITDFRWYGDSGKRTFINGTAFQQCLNLVNVEIYGSGKGGVNGSAFGFCTALKKVVINFTETGSTTTQTGLYGAIFSGCTALEEVDLSLPDNCWPNIAPFTGCTSLETITLRKCGNPGNITNNYRLALQLPALKTVRLVGIKYWGYINSTTKIFQYCTNLTDVYWDGTVQTAGTTFSTSRVSGCPSFTVHCSDGDYTVPSTL